MQRAKPYFYDGRLHIPRYLLEKLMRCGLDMDCVQAARKGLNLDDTARLRKLRDAARAYVMTAPAHDEIAWLLQSADVQFMLSVDEMEFA